MKIAVSWKYQDHFCLFKRNPFFYKEKSVNRSISAFSPKGITLSISENY